ncbi:hypothetical protein ES704_02737 [subsurface metagenome]|jgi:hypothetical protein
MPIEHAIWKIDDSPQDSAMKYWILQHNPKLLPVNIPHPPRVPQNRDYWHISRYASDVDVDDVTFIWHAGIQRGIYNAAIVVSVPPHSSDANNQIRLLMESDDPYWTDAQERDRLRQQPTILIEYQYPGGLVPPIVATQLVAQGFGNLPVLRMPQRGIYRLEDAVGQSLLDFVQQTRP